MSKSRYELELLKQKWLLDPCWNIEDTEGFDEYRPELIQFSKEHDEKWQKEYNEKVRTFAKKKGIDETKHFTFAKFIYSLEARITFLEIETQHLRDKL